MRDDTKAWCYCRQREDLPNAERRKDLSTVATGTLFLLGAFAGLTIYLGLPFAFLKRVPQATKLFLNMLATGILVFLFYDVIGKATEPINGLLET